MKLVHLVGFITERQAVSIKIGVCSFKYTTQHFRVCVGCVKHVRHVLPSNVYLLAARVLSLFTGQKALYR